MNIVKRNAIVPYTNQEMYDLVAEIEAYPEFISWVTAGKVLRRQHDQVEACLEFSLAGFHKKFTTCNTHQPGKRIDLKLVNGPFKHLEGDWSFHDLQGKACKIELVLQFEFESTVLNFSLGPVFNQVANKLVDTFCQRAFDVYGAREI